MKIIFLLLVGLLTGCGYPPIKNPIEANYYPLPEKAKNKTLIIFLPGRWSVASEFETYGFVQAIQEKKLPVDMVSVEAHLAYYFEEQLVPRLKQDIIEPAKAKGYQKIWLVGISMGGLGTLVYAQKHLEDLAGIVALAPYLGEPEVFKEIDNAGGLPQWEKTPLSADDYQTYLWLWLKKYVAEQNQHPMLYLGYGTEDGLREGSDFLGQYLPKSQVFTTMGGHDWDTWLVLWEDFLAKSPFRATY